MPYPYNFVASTLDRHLLNVRVVFLGFARNSGEWKTTYVYSRG